MSGAPRGGSRRAPSRLDVAAALTTVAALLVVAVGVVGYRFVTRSSGDARAAALPVVTTTTVPETTTTTEPPFVGWVDPKSVFGPYAGATVPGLLTFRGNPTRNYYGQGPVPAAPHVLWQYPGKKMCSDSEDRGETTQWCGNGWTGEPAVFERDGRTWLAFGAYDRALHVVDAATGQDILPPFVTGDLIKGSVTIDPDGFPLIYIGSRDNKFRVLAFDRPQLTELWSLDAHAVSPTRWNDDWDGALVLHDWLLEGGENSQMHMVKLNRGRGPDGLVTVAPQLVWHAPGWDDQLIGDVGNEVSIESSVAVYRNTLYFGNSGGLVQGWDIGPLLTGTGNPQRVFRFWTGDDTDASVVVDEAGTLYVGSEWERHNARSREVGQLMKLNPAAPDNPLVWSQHDDGEPKAGVFSTAGLYQDLAIFTTYSGRAIGVDRTTGAIRWEKRLTAPLMSSPVIVGVWLQPDCDGVVHAYDVRNTTVDPPELWSVALGSCIEATPAVWKGRIYIGTRGGFEYALGDG